MSDRNTLTNQKRIRYIVAWLPRADTCVIVGLSGSKVGLDEGWYRLKYDDDGREAYDSGPHESAEVALGAHEPPAEHCTLHPDVPIVVRPSTSANGGFIGWGCAVCNCLEVERLRGFVSDEERSASIDRARNRASANRPEGTK